MKIELIERVHSLSRSYLWNKDWFYLVRVDEKSREGVEYSYLKADMDVADSVEDEWVVAYLALELSKRYDNLAVAIVNDVDCRSNSEMVMEIIFSLRQLRTFQNGWNRKS